MTNKPPIKTEEKKKRSTKLQMACKCCGKFFNITILHNRCCPLRKLQEKYGYELATYMLKIK